MDNFDIPKKTSVQNGVDSPFSISETISVNVSPICQTKDGERYAFVLFTDGKKTAEGKIPNCTLLSKGEFTEEEALLLEQYMKDHLMELKRMAASVDVMGAFLKG